MPWANRGEAAPVEGDDNVCLQALGQRDDRGIGAAQREVCVLLHQVGDSEPVVRLWPFDLEVVHAPQESRLGSWTAAQIHKVRCLSNDHRRNDKSEVGAL